MTTSNKICRLFWGRHRQSSASIRSVFVKSSSAFAAQPASIHHLDEQRTGPILRVAQTVLQHPHDIEANIEADEISQSQRAHGMGHAQLEDLIYGLRRGHAFHHRVNGLVNQWHE